MTIRSLAFALIACTLTPGAHAQEQAAQAKETATPAETKPKAPAESRPEPAAPPKASGGERFVPSEEISEDLSVSFPSDI